MQIILLKQKNGFKKFWNSFKRFFSLALHDFEKIISMIPKGSLISIETQRNSKETLDDFKEDVFHLEECMRRWKLMEK